MLNLYPAIFSFVLFSQLHLIFLASAFWHTYLVTPTFRTMKRQSVVLQPNLLHSLTRYKWEVHSSTCAAQCYLYKRLKRHIEKIFHVQSLVNRLIGIFQGLKIIFVLSESFRLHRRKIRGCLLWPFLLNVDIYDSPQDCLSGLICDRNELFPGRKLTGR